MSDTLQTQPTNDVLDFLSGIEAVSFAREFVKTYGLSEDSVSDVMNLAEDIAYGSISIAVLPEEITKQFGIDEVKSKQAAVDLAVARLLPIEAHVGDVRSFIKKWGGSTDALPVSSEPIVTPESFVHAFVSELPGSMPAHLQHRLEHILVLSVTGHSDATEVLDLLSRSEKTGGMEFEKKDAQAFLEFFEEKKAEAHLPAWNDRNIDHAASAPRSIDTSTKPSVAEPVVNILKQDSISPPYKGGVGGGQSRSDRAVEIVSANSTSIAGSGDPTHSLVGSQPSIESLKSSKPRTDAFSVEDEAEISNVKTQKQSILESSTGTPLSVEQMVEQICKQSAMQFTDKVLSDRCHQIVEARLHDVRSASDTQKQLERTVETGGLGVKGRALADILQIIEEGVDRVNKAALQKIEEDRNTNAISKQTQADEKKTLAEREEKVMTKRYVELTGKMPEEHVASVGPTLARVSGSVSASDMVQFREQKIDPVKVRSVIDGMKKDVETNVTPRVSRPIVADVQFARRLSGPIDELQNMSLTDFRRLAKSTVLCAERVHDQVNLVAEQGFEKRIEAIRAWQSSPLYQLYLSITRAAMEEGKPLETVRAEKEKNGEPVLTQEELAAILTLNSELRF